MSSEKLSVFVTDSREASILDIPRDSKKLSVASFGTGCTEGQPSIPVVTDVKGPTVT